MLHSDYLSVSEAVTAAQHYPEQAPKPIVSVEAEVPGNAYAGKTIFSHPLLVEAMETHFVVVATPVTALDQQLQQPPTNSSPSSPTTSSRIPPGDNTNNTTTRSKMRGNYLYTRVRILDPFTGYDLVPCVDHQLSRASLIQALLDALSMMSVNLLTLFSVLILVLQGLTLTDASKMFLMEPFLRHEEEQQAYGRLHRYGQTKEVQCKVYYTPVSVESRLLEWRKRDKSAEVGDQKVVFAQLKSADETEINEDEDITQSRFLLGLDHPETANVNDE